MGRRKLCRRWRGPRSSREARHFLRSRRAPLGVPPKVLELVRRHLCVPQSCAEYSYAQGSAARSAYPRKGSIAVGSDADLAIWDADKEVTISQSMIHDAMDYTPYEGKRLKGWPVTTLVRGEVVAERGEFVSRRLDVS